MLLLLLAEPPDGGVNGCPVERDAQGRIRRSHAVLVQFKRVHPCPANGKKRGPCPGYVIDHVYPLCAGGCDQIENLQWQTREDAKAKDEWERGVCRRPSSK